MCSIRRISRWIIAHQSGGGCHHGTARVLGARRERRVAKCLRVLGGVVCVGRRGICRVGCVWGDGGSGRRDDRTPARPSYHSRALDGRGGDRTVGSHSAARAAACGVYSRYPADDGEPPYRGQSLHRHGKSRAGALYGAERDFFKPYCRKGTVGTQTGSAAGRTR